MATLADALDTYPGPPISDMPHSIHFRWHYAAKVNWMSLRYRWHLNSLIKWCQNMTYAPGSKKMQAAQQEFSLCVKQMQKMQKM